MGHVFQQGFGCLFVIFKSLYQQASSPILFVKVLKNLLFKVILAPVYDQRVVVLVQSVNTCLNSGLLEKPNVRGGLTGFSRKGHHHLRARGDHTEGVNNYFTLNTLHWIDHNCSRPGIQLFKGLLCVHIDSREPASESRVGMIPSNYHLRTSCLLKHVEHIGLKDWVHSFYTYTGTMLRHGEHVDTRDGILVYKLSKHEPHHLHRNTSATMLQHFQQGEGRYLDLLCCVRERSVSSRASGWCSPAQQLLHLLYIHG
mmetsp:Transcript_9449/g.14233  ORF Transcript_9449/g.14233 Transcript_9449/m.14233 type:complete len:256 (+) Transcript_9449:310-1077(+)